MTPWEASLAGVKAQVTDPSTYHISQLKHQLQIDILKYIELSNHLRSKFKSFVYKPVPLNEKMMLVGVEVPAWTSAEYNWACSQVIAKLSNALSNCVYQTQEKIKPIIYSDKLHEIFRRKDSDRFYLIGSLGYTSLENILINHYYSHVDRSNFLLKYLDVINREYQDVEHVESDLLRLCISLLSIDLIYLWRQSFFILKQIKYY